jgi:hypothetical protein
MKSVRWFARKHLSGLRLINYLRLLWTRKNGYLRATGWVTSILKGYPCDAEGNELPWMNYPFVTFIAERLRDDMTVLEFGSGYSTIFWARHAKTVYAVEDDAFFREMLKDRLPENAQVFLCSPDGDVAYNQYAKYVSETNDGMLFDIAVIDGSDRVDSCINTLPYLKPDGVIIWDDSATELYWPGFEQLQQKGFKKLEFEGLKSGDRGVARTALFYRDQNCLGI